MVPTRFVLPRHRSASHASHDLLVKSIFSQLRCRRGPGCGRGAGARPRPDPAGAGVDAERISTFKSHPPDAQVSGQHSAREGADAAATWTGWPSACKHLPATTTRAGAPAPRGSLAEAAVGRAPNTRTAHTGVDRAKIARAKPPPRSRACDQTAGASTYLPQPTHIV